MKAKLIYENRINATDAFMIVSVKRDGCSYVGDSLQVRKEHGQGTRYCLEDDHECCPYVNTFASLRTSDGDQKPVSIASKL